MNKQDFKDLFLSALDTAAEKAQDHFDTVIPRNYQIELHGAGYPGKLLSDLDTVVDILYLGEAESYRIIDVALKAINASHTMSRVFVRPSNHKPVDYAHTWNDPEGSGPFKQLQAWQLTVLRDDEFI